MAFLGPPLAPDFKIGVSVKAPVKVGEVLVWVVGTLNGMAISDFIEPGHVWLVLFREDTKVFEVEFPETEVSEMIGVIDVSRLVGGYCIVIKFFKCTLAYSSSAGHARIFTKH